MATLTIRNLDQDLKARLRLRAAGHGRSMEEEARQLLRHALIQEEPAAGLGSRITRRFAARRAIAAAPAVLRRTE